MVPSNVPVMQWSLGLCVRPVVLLYVDLVSSGHMSESNVEDVLKIYNNQFY